MNQVRLVYLNVKAPFATFNNYTGLSEKFKVRHLTLESNWIIFILK